MLEKIFQKFRKKSTDASTGRTVILHGHIFKNAGSTFDWSLRQNFGADFCDHRDDKAMRMGGGDYLDGYLRDNGHLKALSSHHLCMPLPESANIKLLPVFFFRHPIVRARSVYEFERRQPEETPGSIHAKKYNFADYVDWRMQPENNPTIRDFQVRYCLPMGYMSQILNVNSYELAVNNLESMSLVGVVERYDESMVVFESILRNDFPEIDLSYVIQNVGTKKEEGKSVDGERQEILEELGVVSSELIQENQFDQKIYDYSNQRLDREIAAINRFDQKLEDFRKRCANSL